jgi:1,4-dihydroxy-2-naphthoate octaprenyltransferase
LNDVEDYKRWIDLPGGHGGSGVLQKAWLRVRDLRALATVCVVLALLAGLPALLTDWKIGVFVGLIGIIGAIGYSSKPLGLKYLALGDLAVFFLCGPLLTIGASLAFFSELRFEFHVLGFAFGLLACAILHANNLQDIDADRASGATTLAGILGFGPSRILLALFYIGAWIALGILGFHLIDSRWTQLLSFTPMLLPLFLTLKLMSTVYSASGTASPLLNLIRIRAAQLHMIYALALAASLLLYQGLFV